MRHFILAILTASCLGEPALRAADLPPIRQVVSFGDSLSDCGAYGFTLTTAPALTWNQQLARHFHDELRPNRVGRQPGISGADVQNSSPGGLCYAQGGARTATGVPDRPQQPPLSGSVQLDHFLAEHGHFNDDQLVTVYFGTNDVLNEYAKLSAAPGKGDTAAPAATRTAIEQAAKDLSGLVQRMLEHGAKHVAVLNLYDLGKSALIGASPILSSLTDDFDVTLAGTLARDPRIVVVDTRAFFADLAVHPASHGFRHAMNEDACMTPTKLGDDCYASPTNWKSPDAAQTYMLISMVHFTARTGTLLANYVLRRVERPGRAAR